MTIRRLRMQLLILLLSIAVLIIYSTGLSDVSAKVTNAIYDIEWQESNKIIESVCEFARLFSDPDIKDETKTKLALSIIEIIERIDKRPGVFAAVYNDNFSLLTDRYVAIDEAAFDPLVYDGFKTQVNNSESGMFYPTYAKGDKASSFPCVSFIKIPFSSDIDEQAVVVLSVSSLSVSDTTSGILVNWCIWLIVIAFACVLLAVWFTLTSPLKRGK